MWHSPSSSPSPDSSSDPDGPSGAFPSALLDAAAGYRYLVHDLGYSPRNIIFSGDSAGAGIALGLARYLSTANLPGLPPPAGMVLLSPMGDLARTHTGPRASCVTNRASDLLNSIVESGYSARALLGRIPPEAAARGSWLSPGARGAAPPGAPGRVPRSGPGHHARWWAPSWAPPRRTAASGGRSSGTS